MKIAFVHDWLVYPGGAEKVFFDIIKDIENKGDYIFKELENIIPKTNFEAKIFTSFYNTNYNLPVDIPVEAVLSGKNINYYRNLFPIFPIIQKKLSRKIEKYNPDLIIISSFAIAKNIDIDKPKVLYLHSMMQYIWSHYEDYLKKFGGIKKLIFKLSSKYLRKWDKNYTNFDYIIANSNYTKKLAEQIYNIKVDNVIFPKVEIPNYKKIDIEKKFNIKGEYYLYIGRLVKLVKNLDIIIDTFNKNGKQLVIVGDGPDKKYLQNLATSKNIKFVGYLSNQSDEYWNLLENAKALINITKESFGIVNYQAGLLGTKLISINDGAINDIPGEKILIDKFEDLEKVIK